MEHIVQFAIGIDDEAIRKNIINGAEKQIIANIEQDIRKNIFNSSYYNKDVLSAFSEKCIEEWLDKHKDELLEKTAIYLAGRLVRTKAAKAVIEDVKKEI